MFNTRSTSGNSWRWPLILLTITLFALATRWFYVSTALVRDPIRGDAAQYVAYAWNLVHHGIFSSATPETPIITADNYRDPGYPLFLASWMKVSKTWAAWYAFVLFSQVLLGALTVTVATQLCRTWLPSCWAASAGLLMAIWPHSIASASFLLTETLFGFLCALGLLLCAHACQRGSAWIGAAAGIVLGAAALTNAILLPFGVLLAAFLAWRDLASRKICVALAVGALLLPGLWAIRNMQLSATDPSNSSRARVLLNFAQGAEPNFHLGYRNSILGDASTKPSAQATLDAVNKDYILLLTSPSKGIRVILQRFGNHPWLYARWYLLQKPDELWGWNIEVGQGDIYIYQTINSPFQTHRAWIAAEAICQAINPLLILLMLASLYFVWATRSNFTGMLTNAQRGSMITVMCLVLFATVVYSCLQAEPRYAIPFRPFEISLAVTTLYGFTTLLRRYGRSRTPTTLTTLNTTAD